MAHFLKTIKLFLFEQYLDFLSSIMVRLFAGPKGNDIISRTPFTTLVNGTSPT